MSKTMTTETPMHPSSRLAAAYLATETRGPSRERLEKIARTFRPNPQHERLLALAPEKLEAMLAGNPSLRMGLGGYQERKAAHEHLQEGQTS